MNCLAAMIGKDTPARTQGQNESILLARASSKAPALHGFGNAFKREACAAEWTCCMPWVTGFSKSGDKVGDEKDRRYKAMKNSSFRAQNVNRTT